VSNFVKLNKGNDWGTEYFEKPGTVRLHGCCSYQRDALTLKEGKAIRVRFRDGHEAQLPVAHKKVHGGYSDHGRETQTVSLVPGVLMEVYGSDVWVSLADVEVDTESLT
jgi:hypothetical protein